MVVSKDGCARRLDSIALNAQPARNRHPPPNPITDVAPAQLRRHTERSTPLECRHRAFLFSSNLVSCKTQNKTVRIISELNKYISRSSQRLHFLLHLKGTTKCLFIQQYHPLPVRRPLQIPRVERLCRKAKKKRQSTNERMPRISRNTVRTRRNTDALRHLLRRTIFAHPLIAPHIHRSATTARRHTPSSLRVPSRLLYRP